MPLVLQIDYSFFQQNNKKHGNAVFSFVDDQAGNAHESGSSSSTIMMCLVLAPVDLGQLVQDLAQTLLVLEFLYGERDRVTAIMLA